MKLVYKRRALRHIEAIHEYISRRNPTAANDVISRIEYSISRLLTIPLSARPAGKGGTRLLVVPGLPYVVVHRVRGDAVEVIAVFHTARNRRG